MLSICIGHYAALNLSGVLRFFFEFLILVNFFHSIERLPGRKSFLFKVLANKILTLRNLDADFVRES